MPVIVKEQFEDHWKPHPRQQDFLTIPDTVKEGFYGGAAGGGKSDVLICLPIVRGFHKNPKFKGIIFRKTFPQLEESLIPKSKEYYYHAGGKYNATGHVWTFPSGATIRFSYMENDDDARSHDTAEYHYAAFDELTHFNEFQYNYITHSRVRSTLTSQGIPAIVRSASNPGNEGHVWVRDRFVAPAPNGYAIIHYIVNINGVDKASKALFIPAKVTDNPTLMKEDPEYVISLHMLPEAEKRAKLYGDWFSFIGQVFSEWREKPFHDEPANAQHIVTPFQIPHWWPKGIGIDWGYTHKTWVGWAALAPTGRFFLYREYCVSKKSVAEWAASVAYLSQYDHNLKFCTMDPSGWQERGLDKTISSEFSRISGFSVEKAVNDRISGKMLLHDLFRWKPRPTRFEQKQGYSESYYQRLFRWYGTERAKAYMLSFLPEEPETNIPIFQSFDTNTFFNKCIPSLTYDEKHPEDVKKVDGDDPYDGGRYLLERMHRYQKSTEAEALKLDQLAKIHEYVAQGDINEYYRQMEKYEAGRNDVTYAIRH